MLKEERVNTNRAQDEATRWRGVALWMTMCFLPSEDRRLAVDEMKASQIDRSDVFSW